MTPTDLFATLRADHDRHRRLMSQLERTQGGSEERARLFDTFVEETEAHAAEEVVCYSRLMGDEFEHHMFEHHTEKEEHGVVPARGEGARRAREDRASPGVLGRAAEGARPLRTPVRGLRVDASARTHPCTKR